MYVMVQWLGLAVGVLGVVEGWILLPRRRRSRGRRAGLQSLLIGLSGVGFIARNAAQIRGWTGTGMDVAWSVTLVASACVIVLAIVLHKHPDLD